MESISEVNKAYIAGIIDGEGYIGVCRKIENGNIQYIPRMEITNTNKAVLCWINEILGLNLTLGEKQTKANWKKSYRLEFMYRKVLAVLTQVYPYLRIKKAQAKLILTYYSYKDKGFRKTKTERLWDKICYQDMKTLNTRGIKL